MISLRVAQIDLMPNKKKTIKIQTGTGEMFFKLDTKEAKTEWCAALTKTMEWVNATNNRHMSMALGKPDIQAKHGFGYDSDDDDVGGMILDDKMK